VAWKAWKRLPKRPQSWLPLCLLLGLLGHAWILSQRADWFLRPGDGRGPTPIEIEKLSDLPVVQTQRLKNPSKGKADFAGEWDQHTPNQTRSPRTGPLQSGGGGASDAEDFAGNEATQDGIGEPELDSRPTRLRELMGFSASPNQLPDSIDLGSDTILNTQHVSYASFLNRVSEEIYQPWVSYANDAVDLIYLTGGKLSPKAYITKIVVSLNGDGEVIAIETVKSSGVEALDQASQRAFWDQQTFPNPPAKMQGTDGVFRFGCDFQFEWRTSSFNIVPWAI